MHGWSAQVMSACPMPSMPSIPWCGGWQTRNNDGRASMGGRHCPQRERSTFPPIYTIRPAVSDPTVYCVNGHFCEFRQQQAVKLACL